MLKRIDLSVVLRMRSNFHYSGSVVQNLFKLLLIATIFARSNIKTQPDCIAETWFHSHSPHCASFKNRDVLEPPRDPADITDGMSTTN